MHENELAVIELRDQITQKDGEPFKHHHVYVICIYHPITREKLHEYGIFPSPGSAIKYANAHNIKICFNPYGV